MFAGSQRLERARRYFDLEEPTDEQAALAQREMLRARGHFARALERAGSEQEAVQARRAWGEADLVLARWGLERGKGGLLSGDDEDLFRWGLAYAREGLALSDLEPGTRAELERTAQALERELSFWR